MVSLVLVGFWSCIAIAFAAMSLRTWRVRRVILPEHIKEADESGYFAGADVKKLKPIFDEMLLWELVAFALTGFCAMVEAVSFFSA